MDNLVQKIAYLRGLANLLQVGDGVKINGVVGFPALEDLMSGFTSDALAVYSEMFTELSRATEKALAVTEGRYCPDENIPREFFTREQSLSVITDRYGHLPEFDISHYDTMTDLALAMEATAIQSGLLAPMPKEYSPEQVEAGNNYT